MVAAADGAMIKRVPLRALRDGILGALAGAAAGLVGLLLAQILWALLAGGFAARALTWMLLGLLIGLGDLLVNRRPQRASYAAIGGTLGGLLGGLIYEGIVQLFRNQSGDVLALTSGLGLVIVGACIGGLIPLARQILSQGELRVISGEQTGLIREVTDTASIGRYDGNDLYLPDAGIAWRHAVVRNNGAGFELDVLPESQREVFIGNISVPPGSKHPLQSGDRIQVGEAVVEFIGR